MAISLATDSDIGPTVSATGLPSLTTTYPTALSNSFPTLVLLSTASLSVDTAQDNGLDTDYGSSLTPSFYSNLIQYTSSVSDVDVTRSSRSNDKYSIDSSSSVVSEGSGTTIYSIASDNGEHKNSNSASANSGNHYVAFGSYGAGREKDDLSFKFIGMFMVLILCPLML